VKLPLNKIRLDGGTQTRARIDENAIEEYAVDMQAGAPFPALIVFHDGTDYWLADGFHRWGAAMELKLDAIECVVHQGTQADAQWFSYSANKSNGMRRTNGDKARAVKAALRHCGGAKSNNEIAKHVGVSDHMVADHRKTLADEGAIPEAAAHLRDSRRCAEAETDKPAAEPVEPGQPARVVNRKGKTYQMKVGQIGKAKKPNRKKYGGISKDAQMPTRPIAKPSEMLAISLPIDNPHMAAKGMLSRYERTFLVALVEELTVLLKEGD